MIAHYQLFLFLHIASVILWLGAGTTLGLLWLHPDADLRARIGALGEWLGPRLFAPASLGALAFGLVLVHEGHWTFHPLWVQLGLGAFAASFVINAAIRAPLVRRFERAPGRFGRVLAALALFELALLYATVADMALKPTGSDTALLAAVGALLAVLAANVVARVRIAVAGTTEA
jgi:hypothetical protein